MKQYTINENTLQSIISVLYSWDSTCIVRLEQLKIESPDGNMYFSDINDLISNICENTTITLETLI